MGHEGVDADVAFDPEVRIAMAADRPDHQRQDDDDGEQDAGERGGKHQAGLTRTTASLRLQSSGSSSQPKPGPGGFAKQARAPVAARA